MPSNGSLVRKLNPGLVIKFRFDFHDIKMFHSIVNELPIDLRENIKPSKFKSEIIEHLWNHDIKSDYENSIADVFEDYRNHNS